MRTTYSDFCQRFEETHLPVNAVKGQDDIAVSAAEEHTRCYLAIDDRLQNPPLQVLSPDHHNIFIEWTYTIDLDRELFIVDDAAAFRLHPLPRERWISYVTLDAKGRRLLSEETPKEAIGSLTLDPQPDRYARARYGDFDVKMVNPKIALDDDEGNSPSPRQHLLLKTFDATHRTYQSMLDRNALQWKPEDFPFREIAFAILSLAAGEMTFKSPETLNRNYGDRGYYLIPDDILQNGQSKLVPRFLYESHLPGKESGSSPMTTIFLLVWKCPGSSCLKARPCRDRRGCSGQGGGQWPGPRLQMLLRNGVLSL